MQKYVYVWACALMLLMAAPTMVCAAKGSKAPPQKAASQGQSLQHTLRLAFAYSPDLKVAQEALLAAMEDVTRVRGGYYPTVGLYAGAGLTQNDNSTTRYNREQYQAFGATNASMRLRQPIWEGGTTQAQVKTRSAMQEARDALVDDAGSTLALSAVASHIDVRRRALLLQYAKQNVQEHETIYNAVQERYAQGIATTGEVNQISARVHRAKAMRSQYQSNLEVARANYLKVTGKPAPAELEKVELPLKIFHTADGVRELALTTNARMLSYLSNIRAMLGEKDYARAALNPKISAEAGPTFQNSGASNSRSADWQAMVNVGWEFNTGGSDLANIRASSARVRQAKQELHSYMDVLGEDIEGTFSKMLSARQQSNEMAKAKIAAKTAREDFYQQFLAGQRGLLDVLDAASEYFSYSSEEELTSTESVIMAYRLLALCGQLLQEFHIEPKGLRTKLPTTSDVNSALDAATWSNLNRSLQDK